MRIGRRITRTSHLLGAAAFAIVLAGCADQRPTSPDVVAKLNPVAAGSIIKSSVVTTTTVCGAGDKCRTSTRYSEIAEKVGLAAARQAMRAISAGGGQTALPSSVPQLPASSLRNVHVSGRTLYADAVKDGSTWHVELTHDDVARGKISAVRFSLNGRPLLASNAKWKDVSGVWYREHTDLTYYHEGRVALQQEKSFFPIAALPGNPSDRLVATLTLSNDVVPIDWGGTCPYDMPVCDWLQAGGDPTTLLSYAISELGWIATSIGNFFTSLWAGTDGADATAQLAETVATAMEAINEPSLVAIAEAIGVAASSAWTATLLESLAFDIGEWLAEYIWIFM